MTKLLLDIDVAEIQHRNLLKNEYFVTIRYSEKQGVENGYRNLQ